MLGVENDCGIYLNDLEGDDLSKITHVKKKLVRNT